MDARRRRPKPSAREKVQQRAARIEADKRARQRAKMGAVGVGALCAVLFAYALATSQASQDIEAIDASDPERVREIFFGGEPWFGVCVDSLQAPAEIPGVITSAAADARAAARSVAMNCSTVLPSGATLYKRFRLDSARVPVAFFVGNGDPPRQITIDIEQDHRKIVTALTNWAAPKLGVVKSARDLAQFCSRPFCALFMHEGKLEPHERRAMRRFAAAHRRVRFAFLDASRLATSMDRALPVLNDGESHLVLFHTRKSAPGAATDATGKERTRQVLAKAFRGDAARPILGGSELATHPAEDGSSQTLTQFLRAAVAAGDAVRAARDEIPGAKGTDAGPLATIGFKPLHSFPKVLTKKQAAQRAQRAAAAAAARERKAAAPRADRRAGRGGATSPSARTDNAVRNAEARRAERRRRAEAETRNARSGQKDSASAGDGAERVPTDARERLDEASQESPHFAWSAGEDSDDAGEDDEWEGADVDGDDEEVLDLDDAVEDL